MNNMKDNKNYASKLLSYLKSVIKRQFIIIIVQIIINILIVFGFLYYLSLYDFTSTVDQTATDIENSDVKQLNNDQA